MTNKNNKIAAFLIGITGLLSAFAALWGASLILVALSLALLVGSFFLYKENKIGKIISIAGMIIPFYFYSTISLEILGEFKSTTMSGDDYNLAIFGTVLFLFLPLVYIIVTLFFLSKSKPGLSEIFKD